MSKRKLPTLQATANACRSIHVRLKPFQPERIRFYEGASAHSQTLKVIQLNPNTPEIFSMRSRTKHDVKENYNYRPEMAQLTIDSRHVLTKRSPDLN